MSNSPSSSRFIAACSPPPLFRSPSARCRRHSQERAVAVGGWARRAQRRRRDARLARLARLGYRLPHRASKGPRQSFSPSNSIPCVMAQEMLPPKPPPPGPRDQCASGYIARTNAWMQPQDTGASTVQPRYPDGRRGSESEGLPRIPMCKDKFRNVQDGPTLLSSEPAAP